MKADRVLKNASIYSVRLDDSLIRAEALAIKDSKIIYVGDESGLEDYIDDETIVTDCHGNTVLPGLADAHAHVGMSARKLLAADLAYQMPLEGETAEGYMDRYLRKVKDFADAHPDMPLVHGYGWGREFTVMGALGEVRIPTRHDLDSVVPDRPVVLDSYCAHALWMNTKAIEMAGLDENTPDPEAGIIGREENGYPNGYFQEPVVINDVISRIEGYQFSEEEYKESIRLYQKEVAGPNGITLAADCLYGADSTAAMVQLGREDALNMRLKGVYGIYEGTMDEDLKYAIEHREQDQAGDFGIDTVKYFVEGELSIIGGKYYTESFLKERNLPKGHVEPLLWKQENLEQSMDDALKAGFNIHVHAMGDNSIRASVRAIDSAQKKNPDGSYRNIIAHVMDITPEDRRLMAEDHIIASIQPYWMADTEETEAGMAQIIGDRCKYLYPNKTLVDEGIVTAYGSDWTVSVPVTMNGLQTAITRSAYNILDGGRKDMILGPPEDPTRDIVDFKQAIKSFTINAAYQHNLEDVTGSLEVGKSADIAIIDCNLEKVDVFEICKAKVIETIFKGKSVFKL
ncbi:MAG: amidohydrolase [Bilifractor sp.]